MKFTITGRYPLGIERTSEDGRYSIWSAKPGTGHLLRYPDDPMRHVVSLNVTDPTVEGGGYSKSLYRTWKLAYAQSFAEQHAKGICKGEGEK